MALVVLPVISVAKHVLLLQITVQGALKLTLELLHQMQLINVPVNPNTIRTMSPHALSASRSVPPVFQLQLVQVVSLE